MSKLKSGFVPVAIQLAAFAGILGYAALMYFLGPLVPLGTIVLGFGLLIIPYLLMEWVATPLVALMMGFQARWSMVTAVCVGVPLVVLFTAVTPVVSSGSEFLAVPVPWLAVYAKAQSTAMPIVRERLVWWGALYVVALIAGRLSRHLRQPEDEETP